MSRAGLRRERLREPVASVRVMILPVAGERPAIEAATVWTPYRGRHFA